MPPELLELIESGVPFDVSWTVDRQWRPAPPPPKEKPMPEQPDAEVETMIAKAEGYVWVATLDLTNGANYTSLHWTEAGGHKALIMFAKNVGIDITEDYDALTGSHILDHNDAVASYGVGRYQVEQ